MTSTLPNSHQDRAANESAPATLHEAFRRAVARFPEHTAVCCQGQTRTYAELAAEARAIAVGLASTAPAQGAIVAILLERSTAMVAAMLGAVEAGCTYLPLDPTYPDPRLLETIADARPAAILTERRFVDRLRQAGVPVLLVEDLLAIPAQPTPVLPATNPDAIAYVIYTSGSTGKPKGVRVTHRNVLRLFTSTEAWFHFNDADVWTMFHSFAFDFSVWEMWGCLLTGGRLVIVPYDTSRTPDAFLRLLVEERVSVLNQTPSAFSLLMQAETYLPVPAPFSLRQIIFGGERLHAASLRPWFARHPNASTTLVNMYGITETTVHVTYRVITADDAANETESVLGEPIPDLQVHLLDDALQPVRVGEVGEMCIGGAGVAAGYLRRPELTAQRFIPDPFTGQGTLYRSGDLARLRVDGELVYLGRADRQVKLSGFRIELGEIEAALLACPGVSQAHVALYTAAGREPCLAAWYVQAQGEPNVHTRLSETLPAHLRPTLLQQMYALPLNGNGKIDVQALPAPGPTSFQPASGSAVNDLEPRILTLWRKALRSDSVGYTDSFFDVGGTSLTLIALRQELAAAFKRDIPITWMFEFPTVRALAARLLEGSGPAKVKPSATEENARRQRENFARMKAQRSSAR